MDKQWKALRVGLPTKSICPKWSQACCCRERLQEGLFQSAGTYQQRMLCPRRPKDPHGLILRGPGGWDLVLQCLEHHQAQGGDLGGSMPSRLPGDAGPRTSV